MNIQLVDIKNKDLELRLEKFYDKHMHKIIANDLELSYDLSNNNYILLNKNGLALQTENGIYTLELMNEQLIEILMLRLHVFENIMEKIK